MQYFSHFPNVFRRASYCSLVVLAFAAVERWPAESLQQQQLPVPVPASASKPAPAAKSVAKPAQPAKEWTRRGDLPRIAPSHFSQQDKYAYYSSLATRNGANLKGREVAVVALRGMDPVGSRHNSGDNVGNYNDTLVVLQNKNGKVRVTEYLGSTRAGQETSTLSPNGVAQIRPGTFEAIPCGEYAEMPCWLLTMPDGQENLPTWRDRNGDGFVSVDEKAYGERNGTTASEILIHSGRYADHGSSIGCQTLPPVSMEQFIDKVGKDTPMSYTLIDANLPNP
jgi:hypothetical protein